MIFRSSARNRLVLAWPRAMKVVWQAICAPKAQMPAKKMGMVFTTRSISACSWVNSRAGTPGNSTSSRQHTTVTPIVIFSSRRKVSRTRA